MSAIAASPGHIRPRRTFAQRLVTATWQYATFVFGGMLIALIYAVVKRFPALGAAAASFIVFALIVLLLAWLYARLKHVYSDISTEFTFVRQERSALRVILEVGTAIGTALQAFGHILFK